MVIRPLTTIDECRKVAELEKTVWGYTDTEDVVPPAVLIASIKRGAILLGAFDTDGVLQGFVYSVPAVKDGHLTQWSHMLGVAPGVRAGGIGMRLKLAQREEALRMGVELIEWTCDPLQALNAHLNFARLGVVVEDYEDDLYGGSSSPLHAGTPTDRFVAQWRLTTPHVERRLYAPSVSLMRDSTVMSAVLVNPSTVAGEWLEPGEPALDPGEDRRVLVEIPMGFTEMQLRRPDLALEWRLKTRQIFHTYFSRGYRAVDFFLARDAARGQYLLARAESLITNR
jgi:predicted GNAT superfamily acetyltransferase